ncbi:MAG: WbqC family protein, partial [Bdellovibrionales bacterium]|nr:WbqC family protein [Bdellovibrionales bacterium]
NRTANSNSRSTVVVLQSSYLPWRGYFDLIRRADHFVFLDNVQFTRQDWRTRNRIKTAQGLQWLSVPVLWRGHHRDKISQILIDNSSNWNQKHLRSLEQAYAHAPYLAETLNLLRPFYEQPPERLSVLNQTLTQAIWSYLSDGEEKQFLDASDFEPLPSDANERLIAICRRLDAGAYLSGPAARAYLDMPRWEEEAIDVRFIEYNYTEYPQLHGAFEPTVSIVDVMANLGPGSLLEAVRGGA